MKILEIHIASKTSNLFDCEDDIFISSDYIALMDGVTSKSEGNLFGVPSGKVCVDIICNALLEAAPNLTAYQMFQFLTYSIYKKYEELNLVEYFESNLSERLSSSIIIYSRYSNQVWRVGDCQYIIDNKKSKQLKKIDILHSHIRCLYLNKKLTIDDDVSKLQDFDSGREWIMPLLKNQFVLQNINSDTDWGYGAVDGFNIPTQYIEIIDISKSCTIIFASDGYPKLYPNLEESERFLFEYLKIDPLMIGEFKSTKGLKTGNMSFDDRSYIKFII